MVIRNSVIVTDSQIVPHLLPNQTRHKHSLAVASFLITLPAFSTTDCWSNLTWWVFWRHARRTRERRNVILIITANIIIYTISWVLNDVEWSALIIYFIIFLHYHSTTLPILLSRARMIKQENVLTHAVGILLRTTYRRLTSNRYMKARTPNEATFYIKHEYNDVLRYSIIPSRFWSRRECPDSQPRTARRN
jgi:hypothetical protein